MNTPDLDWPYEAQALRDHFAELGVLDEDGETPSLGNIDRAIRSAMEREAGREGWNRMPEITSGIWSWIQPDILNYLDIDEEYAFDL